MNNLIKYITWFAIGFGVTTFIINVVSAQVLAPEPFQNSKIERALEDGSLQKFDGNEYMIVRRGKNTSTKKNTDLDTKCPKDMICVTPEDFSNKLVENYFKGYNQGEKRIVQLQNQRNFTITDIVKPGNSYLFKREKKPVPYYIHRISLLGGFGPNSRLYTNNSIYAADVTLNRVPVLGLQYQIKLTNRLNIGILGFSNESGFLSIGVDF